MEEAEWAVESCKATGKPTAVSLCIGPQGDLHGIPTGECAVRLAHAGIECSDSRIFCTKSNCQHNCKLWYCSGRTKSCCSSTFLQLVNFKQFIHS